ncbi:lipase [Naegleria gruberi]|uniref:Lipase n=1 Tax=Naegleria gruberi TaxID=5762 RepID=D2W260_NAEGR|nr:lipase [Naegleria gruberi]EFC36811.1 lipase [Naegleria gruberi]|eukprot:XP_002669555.1 lipase [Naegleria gruberi]
MKLLTLTVLLAIVLLLIVTSDPSRVNGSKTHNTLSAETLGLLGEVSQKAKFIASIFAPANYAYNGLITPYSKSLKTIKAKVTLTDVKLAAEIAANYGSQELSTVQGYKLVKNFVNAAKATNCKVYFNSATKSAIVSFKGTQMNDPVDWANNLKTAFSSFQIGSSAYAVHTGFLSEYLVDRQNIFDTIKSLGLLNEIGFYGHSQGGSLSELAAVDYLGSGKRPETKATIKVVTFGQPRVGDANFAAKSNQVNPNFVRVITKWKELLGPRQDIVPISLPVGAGYRHAGLQLEVQCVNSDFINCHLMKGYSKSMNQ